MENYCAFSKNHTCLKWLVVYPLLHKSCSIDSFTLWYASLVCLATATCSGLVQSILSAYFPILVDSELGENPYTASGFSMISLAAFGLSIGLCSYLNLVPLPLWYAKHIGSKAVFFYLLLLFHSYTTIIL